MSRYEEIYDDAVASFQKYCVDKVAALLSVSPGLQYLDWDSVSEVHELPDTDLLGPSGLGITEESSDMFQLVVGIGVCTVNDTNLMRLRKMASNVFADFRPTKTIPIYRRETASLVSWAVVEGGTSISPIVRSGSRPRQFINFSARLDPMASQRT
jgi:hypothetical protein